ncbi:type II secretion protein [Vibrio sp. 10N.286.49.B3]|uniref:AAA family ATPase n=1 Tax=Vibrio sp. 10N.286.49.B3 TaxID=1880855 RepID=UPI000C84B02A|nr:AAA family ATPase [Vibrio sp. 10N.286.49.B3]PMH41239.1 type II secretion protein [Vibrio sp. 10N.286.49.B3]
MSESVLSMANKQGKIRLKTNLTVWILYSSDAFQSHIKSELEKCNNMNLNLVPMDSVTASKFKSFSPPDLIVVEAQELWAESIIKMHGFDVDNVSHKHEALLVIFGDESDSTALKTALQLGAADFISADAEIDDLLPLLKSIADDKIASRNLGELLVFINAKGGSGASTVAVNSAVEMATHYPGDVLLLDLDLQFGVIDDYLNLSPAYGLADAIVNVADLDEMSLDSLVTKHSSGLHTLSFMQDNSDDNYDKAKQIRPLLPILRELYPYVIVDLSRGVDRLFSCVIAPATKAFIVTQQNLVAIKNITKITNMLTFDFGLTKDQMTILVNRFDKHQSITLKHIEETFDKDITIQLLPNDFKVASESCNLGQPFTMTKKNSALTKAIVSFSQEQLPAQDKPKGWLTRMFS